MQTKLRTRILCVGLGCAAWAVLATTAWGIDRVKLSSGSQQTGEVTGSTATEVTLEVGATRKQIPVNEIDSIQFEGEPSGLAQARQSIASGRYADALAQLNKVPQGELKRPLITQDVQFYQALAIARQALAGSGSVLDAGKRMLAFEKANPTSWHDFAACEVLGDLLMAMGNYPVAETYYAKLGSAPWPEYKVRAAVLTGRALVGQKKYDQALTRFEQVLGANLQGNEISAQKMAATLGKAEALSGSGNHSEAVKLVDEVIAKAGPDEEELLGRAYTVKGTCLQAGGQVKPAIVAYLHVDLLYPRSAAQHAEALAHLADLFTADNKPQRAAQARATLKQKYPKSTWANR